MGFGGGGGQQTTQYNPTPITPPLQNELIALASDNLKYQQPYNVFGAGYQMANQSPMGQVYTPGPNQTLFGNPYTQTGHEPYFGQSAQAPTRQQMGLGGGASGGSGQGGGGGGGQNWAQNYGAGSKLTGLMNGGGYQPPPVQNLPAGHPPRNQGTPHPAPQQIAQGEQNPNTGGA